MNRLIHYGIVAEIVLFLVLTLLSYNYAHNCQFPGNRVCKFVHQLYGTEQYKQRPIGH